MAAFGVSVFWICVWFVCVLNEVGIATRTDTADDVQEFRNEDIAALDENNDAEENAEAEVQKYLTALDEQFSQECNKYMKARWAYMTNVTKENSEAMEAASLQFQLVKQKARRNIAEQIPDWSDTAIHKPAQVRQFRYYRNMGTELGDKDLEKMNELLAQMETIYSTATICPYSGEGDCTLSLSPDLTDIMARSRNYSELLHVWTSWRDMTGKRLRQLFVQFAQLSNDAAQANGFTDTSEHWLQSYEEKDFPSQLQILWTTEHELWPGQKYPKGSLKDFYENIHAYVRDNLNEMYGSDNVKKYGALPAHVLGDMWAQNWVHIGHLMEPYEVDASLDVTDAMLQQNYTRKLLFEKADAFFQSLGFDNMTDTFYEKSMFEKPADRNVVCHASAEDFCMGKADGDYRIKMCTEVNHQNLITVHHEMGHIQYFMQYRNQPYVFREGANPGFHEAIGDTIALAVNSLSHLVEMGLLNYTALEEGSDKGSDVEIKGAGEHSRVDILSKLDQLHRNYLFHMALQKVSFLPFAYAMDLWRWGVFRGDITEKNMNEKWWELRRNIQGMAPPVERTEDDFDPGAKYHIAANVPYIRYFVSYILQFQFYEQLCRDAGQYDPNDSKSKLFLCDFSKGENSAQKFREMMTKGFSEKWQDTLHFLTGENKMSSKPLLTYFKDIYRFLKFKNRDGIGWGASIQNIAKKQLKEELKTLQEKMQAAVQAQWQYYTYITPGHAEIMADAELVVAKTRKALWKDYITQHDWEDFVDDAEGTRRQFKLLSTLGVSALPDDKFTELMTVVSNMTATYSKAKICPYENQECDLEEQGIPLSPDLSHILSRSHNYDELSYVWSEWRRVTGVQMKSDFVQYISLSNEAALANNMNDMSELWLSNYESDTFRQELEDLWLQVEPLYKELHAYVRLKLRGKYGEHRVGKKSPIPAHLLGNMWSQTWGNVMKVVTLFPDAPTAHIHVTEQLEKQNKTILEMYNIANDFFMSLNLENMESAYDEDGGHAMIVKPSDRDVVCHASAWDFFDNKNFGIKMCTERNMEDLITIHHEMGHIQYYMQYKEQPVTFRDGANPGFHEAIGDVVALSAQTPTHLKKLDLLPDYYMSHESDVNYLLILALDKLAFIPFAYIVDLWRWNVFNGSYSAENWNYEWWKLREQYQGINPPVSRTEDELDAAAKYHVAASVPYIRYFVSHILQFEFHKALCIEANEYDPNDSSSKPLHKCDIYKKTAAGAKLKKLLQKGLSRHWEETLKEMTGSNKMNASALLEYFEPLRQVLREEIKDEYLGWDSEINNFMQSGNKRVTDNKVPIIVGGVLAGLVVIVVIAYFVGRSRTQKSGHVI